MFNRIVDVLPPSIRKLVFRLSFKSFGTGSFLDYGSYIRYPNQVEVGRNVEINRGFEVYPGLLLRNSRIVIEDDVVIGPNVCLFGAGQKFSSEDLIDVSGDIVIRKGAYIGANTVIRYGVEIGERSIVGAGSVVVKDVKELDVVAGNPARSLRE